MTGFQLQDHTADVMVEATGETLAEAFEQIGRGTFACMADLEAIAPEQSIEITIEAADRGSLLYDFIDELIYQRDIERMLFSEFDVTIEDDGHHLSATLYGTGIGDIAARDVKAPTYSEMEIEEREDGTYSLQIVLDV